MPTLLIHGLWYLLPDDTPVRAQLFVDELRLLSRAGQPLFIVIRERVFNPATTRFEPQRCDLTVDDFRLADRDMANA